jgi:hypothetical protein
MNIRDFLAIVKTDLPTKFNGLQNPEFDFRVESERKHFVDKFTEAPIGFQKQENTFFIFVRIL